MKGVSFHVTDLQREMGKKGLAEYGGAVGREVVCSRAAAKIQCYRWFRSRFSLSCEEMVAGKISVTVQSRDPLLGLGSVAGLCG